MRILTLDIETYPLTVNVFDIWNQNVGINQIRDSGGMLCWAAKFHDERAVRFASLWDGTERSMVREIHGLLEQADVVMGWNSNKFDLRWLNRCFVKNGLSEARPFNRVDLMRQVKKKIYLPSYKLDYVAQWLGVGAKVRTGGFDLWADVMAKDTKAQAKMARYNKADTRLTEKVFDKLNERGWITLPNASINGGECCPNCGSEDIQQRGFAYTTTRKYPRFQCKQCGSWGRGVYCEPGGAKLKACA